MSDNFIPPEGAMQFACTKSPYWPKERPDIVAMWIEPSKFKPVRFMPDCKCKRFFLVIASTDYPEAVRKSLVCTCMGRIIE